MKCFVTGATGFIGSYVVKSLVEAMKSLHCIIAALPADGWMECLQRKSGNA